MFTECSLNVVMCFSSKGLVANKIVDDLQFHNITEIESLKVH
jgi:hypothetical protein